eukprot:c7778_g1_i3.p1 GENE.c7778_g1_i3~~c7778_g1_i3.p1  ORF type:complete len:230 (+),score=58.30 c7778_g1_i3:471-1160(+)
MFTGPCQLSRSLVANLGASAKYSAEHLLTPESQELLAKASVLYIAGFFLVSCFEAAKISVEYAAGNNKVLGFNLGAPYISQQFLDRIMIAIPVAAFVFGNSSEAIAFAKANDWEEQDLVAITQRIARLPQHINITHVRTVVITQGTGPTIVATRTQVTFFAVVAIPDELLVDTNGAGDAFVGGFLARMVLGKAVQECVEAGHYAASVVVRHSGCSFPPLPHFVPSSARR